MVSNEENLSGVSMITIQQITEYLSEHISDPVPKYIFIKEILKAPSSSPDYIDAHNRMTQSKWYRDLVDDQMEDGSWGPFRGGGLYGVKAKKHRFPGTQSALYRARELGLTKEDPCVAKSIRLMERDIKEKSRDYPMSTLASNINMFDPENPLIQSHKNKFIELLRAAFIKGFFDNVAWYGYEESRSLYWNSAANAMNLMLMRETSGMEEMLQRQYLKYVWGPWGTLVSEKPFITQQEIDEINLTVEDVTLRNNAINALMNKRRNEFYKRKYFNIQSPYPPEGFVYMYGPPAKKQCLENKYFPEWLSCLELMSGYSLFGEFMKDDIYPFLLSEAGRLITGDVVLPKPASGHVKNCGLETNGRYADSWRDINKRKTDMVLRIARILVKC